VTSVSLDYTLRRMTEADLPNVLKNERRAYTHPWSEGIFLDCMGSAYESWLMIFEGRIVGHGILSAMAGEAHILNICIHPDYQSIGLGRLLVEFMLGKAEEKPVNTIFLEVRPSNRIAYKLYSSLGFNEIGIRKDYYPAFIGREDAIVLGREVLRS